MNCEMKEDGVKCQNIATYEVRKGKRLVMVLCETHALISLEELSELKQRSKLVPKKLEIKKV
jgi:hypothetical protein